MCDNSYFITGGAGFLGRGVIERYYGRNKITVYSRDEAKHYYLKKQFPNINCVIGDIRNYKLLKEASKGHNIGIFTASLKQIEAVDNNVEEGKEIIIDGALNSKRCAIENNMESACFISSDKSRSATTLYGAMKFVAGESFIVHAEKYRTKLSSAIYGNVLNSTGSVIPLIWNSIQKNYPLWLYSEDMTRFMITIDEAVDLIENALNVSGFNVVPKIKSFKIKDLFEIYEKRFGLKYTIGEPRVSEKIDEILISKEESPRVTKMNQNKYLYMHYKNIYNEIENKECSSKDYVVSKDELDNMLSKYNWFEVVK